ncbi:rho GTPase-activating protein 20-like isoform X1 [Equus caballus]|uniref:rho GTPase-activating protein 20-like isoform X1 n=1 Tax=Equus caballus TaxID=9796 RepID=UPI0038B243DD
MATDLDNTRILRLQGLVYSALLSAVDVLDSQCQELKKTGCFRQSKSVLSFQVVLQGFTSAGKALLLRWTPTVKMLRHLRVPDDHTLLIHGPVELKRGWRRQKRHLFLLSDLLLITNTNYKKNFKIENKVPLNTIWIANCLDKFGEADTCAKRSFVLGWPTVNFVATFSSSELKEKWHSSLQRLSLNLIRCINLAKEEDQPKSIPLKIITEDIKNCVCSVTVTVTNSDTVNNIINMSLPMLGITGSEKDYQLWVSFGKKEAPCPLTGHEHPYGIKMSHLPATGLLPQGPEDSTFQESPGTQGQFILKPRHPARNQQRKESGQKSVRMNFMGNWVLQHGSSACQDLPHTRDATIPKARTALRRQPRGCV